MLRATGEFAAGSFYLPLKKIKAWALEGGWLMNGLFSWIAVPLVVARLTVPDLFHTILNAPSYMLGWTYSSVI